MSVLFNLAIIADQALNCVIKLSDGWGQPDEMLSARAWRLRYEHPWLRRWIDRAFFWDRDHCRECYLIELERRQLHPAYCTSGSPQEAAR